MAYAVQFKSYLTDNQHIEIPLNVQSQVNAERNVTIIILEEENQNPIRIKKRQLGTLNGLISIPDDFNEPLDDLKDYL